MARRLWVRIPLALKDMTEISLKRRKSLKHLTKKKRKKKINNLGSMARRLWVRIPLALKDMTEISLKRRKSLKRLTKKKEEKKNK